jgi:hypothetical protein
MSRQVGPYTIEFWEDEHGRKPVLDWIRNDLTPTQRRAIGTAMRAFLERLGPDVCASQWGKWVAPGIAEFRLRMTGKQVVNAGWATEEEIDTSEKLLLRVFFHVHGDKIIMLLEGYDKGAASSAKAQQTKIASAQKRLQQWKARSV